MRLRPVVRPAEALLATFQKNKLSVCDKVAYAENFHEGGFHSVAYGGHLYLVCAVFDVTT